jgi:hypothetical protein
MHPLDHWTNSTGHTLGLVDVRYFFRELVATFPYKYPFPPLLLHAYSELWHQNSLLSFMLLIFLSCMCLFSSLEEV